jgi:hypothetical protein
VATLSNEFSTEMLKDMVTARLEDVAWEEFGGQSTRMLSADEKTLMLRAARYKLRIGAYPASCKIKVTWKERFSPDGATPPQPDVPREVSREWTGSPCYPGATPNDDDDDDLLITDGGEWFTLPMPTGNGSWGVEDIETECVPDS